ncbi:MAG: AMP-binding protein [Flavobacteriaceae bacterium]|nr:AMP-binding protein [Flavobacteriaceae bacterium]
MSYTKFYKSFTLNGRSFENVEELLSYSETISKDVFSFLKYWFDTTDLITVQTSGSTGKPTTIQLKKEYMVNSAIATGDYFDVHEKTKALLCLSPNYIAGKMMLVRALVLGWQLEVIEPDSNPLKNVKSNYDFCAMIPLQLHNSLLQLQRIKKMIVGGGVVSNELIDKLQEVSTKVYVTYGMTETITHVAIKQLNNFKSNTPLRGRTAWQSHENNYNTLPNIKVTTDNRNCLVINAPKVSDTEIITNDLVELISETEFKWLGRYDTIINSGGVKLIPEQIEKKLSIVIDCRFFVAGIPDEVLGEKLVLIVEIQDSRFKIQDLKFKITNLTFLHKYEIPKEIYAVEKFVETETKKIQRQLTLELLNL